MDKETAYVLIELDAYIANTNGDSIQRVYIDAAACIRRLDAENAELLLEVESLNDELDELSGADER